MILPASPKIYGVVSFLRGLMVVSILLPIGFLATFSWVTYELALSDAERLVQRTVDVLHENTLKVFETQELILDQVVSLMSGRKRETISDTAEISSALKRLEEGRAQIASIWLLDAEGQVRASSVPWTPGLNGSDRDYFQAQVKEDIGTYLGKAYIGRATGRASFGFSRRWPTPDGAFGGVVSISVSSDYFSTFFHNAAPEIEHMVVMVRTDGEVLARNPARSDLGPIPEGDPLMQAIGASDTGSLWRVSRADGVERLYGYRRVSGYPLFVALAISKSAILQPWFKSLAIYGGVTAVMGLGFVSLTLFALIRVRQEEEALAHAAAEARQREEIEARLRHSQKLEALGQLTAGVAHDFGNLLFNILGNLELLRDQPGHPRAPSRVEDALEAAERGKKLLQSLLAFARRQPLALTTLDVNTVIAGMEDLLQQSLGYKARLVLKPAADPWLVLADTNQLEMAVLNLAINARDAITDGGTVEIETANVALNGQPEGLEGEFVALAVSDTGRGMSEVVLEHAFEPFFTTKEPGKGTGLGLASVYGFAKQCGGAAVIQSKVGRGTVVTIYLPRSERGSAPT